MVGLVACLWLVSRHFVDCFVGIVYLASRIKGGVAWF